MYSLNAVQTADASARHYLLKMNGSVDETCKRFLYLRSIIPFMSHEIIHFLQIHTLWYTWNFFFHSYMRNKAGQNNPTIQAISTEKLDTTTNLTHIETCDSVRITQRQSLSRHNFQLRNDLPVSSCKALLKSFPYYVISDCNGLPPAQLESQPSKNGLQSFKSGMNRFLVHDDWFCATDCLQVWVQWPLSVQFFSSLLAHIPYSCYCHNVITILFILPILLNRRFHFYWTVPRTQLLCTILYYRQVIRRLHVMYHHVTIMLLLALSQF